MKRFMRLLCSMVLLLAVTLSASGMAHTSGGHDAHMTAMISSAADHGAHEHVGHMNVAHDADTMDMAQHDHGDTGLPDPLSCCAAMAGACSGMLAFFPAASAWEPSTSSIASYPLSTIFLSGIDPDRALRPPRA